MHILCKAVEMSVHWEIRWIDHSYQLVPDMVSLNFTDYTPPWPILQRMGELQDLNIHYASHIFPLATACCTWVSKIFGDFPLCGVHAGLLFAIFSYCGLTPNKFQV